MTTLDNKERAEPSSTDRPQTFPGTPSTGWQADFAWLWRGSAVSQVGTMCTAIANPLLALHLTGSAVAAGWVTAASTISSLFFFIPAGWVADRFRRRRIMLISQCTRLSTVALLVYMLTCGEPWLGLLIITALADGACTTFYNTAEFTTIPNIVPDDDLSPAVAKSESRSHVALLLGRPLGGALYGLHLALPYGADLLSCLFSIATLSRIKARNQAANRTTEDGGSLLGQLRECSNWIRCDPYTRRVLIVCATTNFSFQIVFLFLVVQAEGQGTHSFLIGLLTAASGLGGAIGSFAAPQALKRLSPIRILLYSVCFWISLPLVVLASDRVEYGMAVWAGVSFMGANLNVALYVHLMTHAPKPYLGRVTSLNGFLLRGATALGALCGGYVIAAGWATGAFQLILIAICLLVVFLVWTTSRRTAEAPTEQRSEERPTDQAPPEPAQDPAPEPALDHEPVGTPDAGHEPDTGSRPPPGRTPRTSTPRTPSHAPGRRSRRRRRVPVSVALMAFKTPWIPSSIGRFRPAPPE